MDSERFSRRAMMKGGVGMSVLLLAGCADDDPVDDNDVVDDDDDVDDDDNDVVDDDDDMDDDDDNGWEDIDEFYFEGRVEAWIGIEPALIEDEDNPTITLIEGQEYVFRWVNGDGVLHNMEIRDADGEIIDDYQSDDVDEEGEEATIDGVVATEEMDVYICTYHQGTQVGDIEVQSG